MVKMRPMLSAVKWVEMKTPEMISAAFTTIVKKLPSAFFQVVRPDIFLPGRKIICFFGILLLGILSSCIKEDPVALRKIENVKFNNISKEGISLDIAALIENNTIYRFRISDAKLDIMLNQVSIGQVKLKDEYLIKRRSAQSYTFRVEASYSDLLSGGIASIVNLAFKKKIRCSCKGWIEVKKWGISRKVPVEFDQDVSLNGT